MDRFYKKLEARTRYQAEKQAREAARQQMEQSIAGLGLDERVTALLTGAGLNTVAELAERVKSGDENMLTIEGLGRKNLIDIKKRLRARGLLKEEQAEAPAA
ncbi:MAG: DNA-directed RNA polymerase subunit alpha C-terminal domain-containing protein [Anaerolineales bacterium]|nr:DNA-directed RNA polymerase subunit alpha C-terminal domain-containing protein [Anaerolineales bacterium]